MNFLRIKSPFKFFIGIGILSCGVINSQVGPGGVGTATNLRGWYDAGSSITLTGGLVSTWGDKSGNALHGTQTTASKRPTPNATGFNYNPTVFFDGQTEYISIPNQMASTVTGVSAFAVVRQTATNRDPYGMILVGQANTSGAGGGYGLISASPGNNFHAFAVENYTNNIVFSASTLSEPTLMTGNFNGTTPGAVQYFRNGASQGTNTYAGAVGSTGNSFIGSAETAGGFCFYGDIAEIAIYNSGLSGANTTKVETYLSLKYSISKSGDYLNSAGATIYSNAAPYNNDIIGIGRDDNSTLNQRQSKAYDDSTRVFIGTLAASNAANGGSFGTNNQFIVMGHNNDRLSAQFTEKPASVYSRLRREWKVTNTGFTGNFNFSVRLNSIGAAGTLNGAHLRLLVDTDGNFSDATVVNLGISASGGLITVSSITPADFPVNTTRYITIASANSNSPLPIELLSFESLMCGMEACIKWKTATEKNNDYFEVERSADGSKWTMISKVPGAGNSVTIKNYETKDALPLWGTSYYRLKQFDTDGTHSFSNVIALNNRNLSAHTLKALPNPADDEVSIPGFVANELKLYDPLGNEVSRSHFILANDRNETRINTSALPEGVYILTGNQAGEERKALRLIVSHR